MGKQETFPAWAGLALCAGIYVAYKLALRAKRAKSVTAVRP